jgi:hypothetical protein
MNDARIRDLLGDQPGMKVVPRGLLDPPGAALPMRKPIEEVDAFAQRSTKTKLRSRRAQDGLEPPLGAVLRVMAERPVQRLLLPAEG